MTWRVRRVRELATLFNGYPFDSSDFSDNDVVPLIRIRDVMGEEFGTFVPEDVVPPTAIVDDGDVLIGMDGDFNLRYWNRGRAALNQRVCALRDNSHSDLRYLAYALPPHLQVINDLTYSTTVKHLASSQVQAIRLWCPDLVEQRAIADFLDRETAKIDALIKKQNEMIDLLRARRLSNIDAVISSAPGVQGTPLRNVVDIQTGITLGKTYGADVEVREYPYLRVANVQTGYVDTEDLATIELPPSIARQAMLRDGDVLITEGGDRAALARGSLWHGPVDPCLHQNHIYALRPRLNRLLAKYLVYVLEGSAARQYFESTRRQTTNLSATNSRLVRAFRFTLPTVDDQRFLLERLDDATARIDALIAKAEEFVELAKERRAALITAAVTGQLDVSGKGDWDGACADDPDLLAVG